MHLERLLSIVKKDADINFTLNFLITKSTPMEQITYDEMEHI